MIGRLKDREKQELQQKITSFLTNELGTLASQLASSLESLSFQA